jgi:hypothetical protein
MEGRSSDDAPESLSCASSGDRKPSPAYGIISAKESRALNTLVHVQHLFCSI